METWRRAIGHEGYVVTRLRVLTPEEGGRSRAVQSGYRAQWWLIGAGAGAGAGHGERAPDGARPDELWLGGAPLDVVGDRRSIRPGEEGVVHLHPMDPAPWQDVVHGAVLHLREREGMTLGIATVEEVVDLPGSAPLRLDAVPREHGVVLRSADRPAGGGLVSRLRSALGRDVGRRR
jgi:hypothetical protein